MIQSTYNLNNSQILCLIRNPTDIVSILDKKRFGRWFLCCWR